MAKQRHFMTHNRILIAFRSHDTTHADWVISSEEGNILQTIMHGELKNIAAAIQGAEVTIVIPAQDVLLTQTTLPKLSRHKLRQALPFALEDQLIDDVSELHFAVADYQDDGTIPVAIISKAKMQTWISALKDLKIEPLAMMPATLALPLHENQWEIFSFDNINIARTGKYSGLAADNNMLNMLLDLKFKEQTQHETINITRSTAPEKMILEKMAQDVISLPFINLLQGEFPAKRKTTQTKNVWKFAGYCAAAWIALAFFSNIISFFILHSQSSNVEDKINAIYHRNFPHANSIVAPRERMETKLKEMTSATQKNNFLSLLATVGQSLTKTNGIHLQNLDYRNGIMTLDVSSATYDNLDSLTRNLNASGLNVKQQNSAITGTQVKATLLINAGAA
jgi:general secretion pathway protein L